MKQQVIASTPEDDQAELDYHNPIASPTAVPRVGFQDGVRQSPNIPSVVPLMKIESWKDFMNKGGTATCEAAIEVLAGNPVSLQPIWNMDDTCEDQPQRRSSKSSSALPNGPLQESGDIVHTTVPERVRINSTAILQLLAGLDKTIEHQQPLVMLRPFKLLVHNEDKIRSLVRKAEFGELLNMPRPSPNASNSMFLKT